jgi:hypothetical protein
MEKNQKGKTIKQLMRGKERNKGMLKGREIHLVRFLERLLVVPIVQPVVDWS